MDTKGATAEGPYHWERFTDRRDGRLYTVTLYHPHVLALAVNRRWPDRANRYAVNIGAGDGISAGTDPVYPLYQAGFGGLAIEADDHPALYDNLPSPAITKRLNCTATPETIAKLLAEAGCPQDPDFLKIDIDGYDGDLLRAILEAGYRPKVIQLEVNPDVPPPIQFAVLYHPDYAAKSSEGQYTGFYGCSTAYAAALGARHQYRLVYLDFVSQWTHDVVLIDRQYLPAAIALFGIASVAAPLRDRFLNHPAGSAHSWELGVNSFAWRQRQDFPQLLTEVRAAMDQANAVKHGSNPVPYLLSL